MMDRSICMRRVLFLILAATLLSVAAVPASAGGASVDRVDGPFESFMLVDADPDNGMFVFNAVMCDWVQRVERPDGSAVETMKCHLTDYYEIWVWDGPEEGHFEECEECGPPEKAFVDGPVDMVCGQWMSDYWWQTDMSVVFANSLRATVTPSGNVSVTTKYPAEPLCD